MVNKMETIKEILDYKLKDNDINIIETILHFLIEDYGLHCSKDYKQCSNCKEIFPDDYFSGGCEICEVNDCEDCFRGLYESKNGICCEWCYSSDEESSSEEES